MALSDENHHAFVKQVALDWRETVRERHNRDLLSPTLSMLNQEQSIHRYSETRTRGSTTTNAERRSSTFYRPSFAGGSKPVEIERSEGSMQPDRIRVTDDVNLYLHQPVPLSNAIRESLQRAGQVTSDSNLAADKV